MTVNKNKHHLRTCLPAYIPLYNTFLTKASSHLYHDSRHIQSPLPSLNCLTRLVSESHRSMHKTGQLSVYRGSLPCYAALQSHLVSHMRPYFPPLKDARAPTRPSHPGLRYVILEVVRTQEVWNRNRNRPTRIIRSRFHMTCIAFSRLQFVVRCQIPYLASQLPSRKGGPRMRMTCLVARGMHGDGSREPMVRMAEMGIMD